ARLFNYLTMKRLLLPLGIENFRKLVKHHDSEGNPYLYIDKSELIKEVWDNGEDVTLITRPRRFGKTLNLSMLQHFFASEVLGAPTKGLFDELAISKHQQVMKLQGKYSVIFITLKGIRAESKQKMEDKFKAVIQALYEEHLYLLEPGNGLMDTQIENYRSI